MTDPSDQAIATAAYDEFLSMGYDGASVSNVAVALGVDPDALSERFKSKYDLWFLALCQALDGLREAVDLSDSGTPLERLRRACEAYVEFGLSNPQAYRFIYMPRSASMPTEDVTAPGNISSRATMLRLVRRCIREGVFPEQSHELALQGLWCALHGLVGTLLSLKKMAWSRELRDEVLETYLVGLQYRGRPTT